LAEFQLFKNPFIAGYNCENTAFLSKLLKGDFSTLLSLEVKNSMDKNDDNHANQCNPNNDAYWQSRGEDERPEDWEERAENEK